MARARGFGFGRGRARERVILGSGLAFGQGLLDDHVDGAAVFRVHADHGAGLGGRAHGFEDAGVVEHENAGIGHEQFEAGDAFADQLRHFGQLRVGQVGDDAVKSVIGDGFRRRLLHPGIEGGAQGLALVLDGEVDQRGGAAEGGGASAGFKIVGAGGAAEGHVEMGVDIDPAGEHVLARGVDQARGIFARQAAAQGNHPAVFNGDVGLRGIGSRDHGAAGNDGVEPHWLIPWLLESRRCGPKRDVFYATNWRLCFARGELTNGTNRRKEHEVRHHPQTRYFSGAHCRPDPAGRSSRVRVRLDF